MNTDDIWNIYKEDIERFIYSKIKDSDITKDIVQEVFTKVHLHKEQLQDEAKLKSWLFSIARNITYDFLKKSKKAIALDEQYLETDTTIEEEETHTEKDCLPGLIKNLPEKYRIPLYLSDIEGLKQSTIAEQLNLPLATVKSQIQRGRKLIIKGYMDCCDYKLNKEGKLVGEIKEKALCKICCRF
ncbi:sigma-70 family RNA polymerase sigma factor [Aquimarina rhabdastrellae]